MLINLQKYPFLRLLIPMTAGIIVATQIEERVNQNLLWTAVGLFFMLTVYFHVVQQSFSFRWVQGLMVFLFMFSIGLINTRLTSPASKPDNILNQKGERYLVRVVDPPAVRELTTKLSLEVVAVYDSLGRRRASGSIMSYARNSDLTAKLRYGDILLLLKPPEPIAPPTNPGQFDYRAHLKKQGVYHQMFLKENDWVTTGNSVVNPIYALSYAMRDHLLRALQVNGLSGDEYAVASAILLGYDDQLPRFLRKGYTAAGAMHVLCVSGLHVGIVYLIINFLLGVLGTSKASRFLRILLLSGAIWTYAMLTGLSPSVLRATVMLSFVLLGRLFNRKGNVINSLAASAFLLLCVDPMTLYHLGFQLSYTAVLGIVLFHKPIYDLIFVKNKVLNYIWEISAVSIAAQIGTTPLAIYYFDQFPVYFLLSNIIVVPLSFLVIVAGMGVLIFSFIPFVSGFMGVLTSALLFALNTAVLWVERLPGSTLQGIQLLGYESVMLYILLSIILYMIVKQHYKPLLPALMLSLVLMFSFTWRTVKHQAQSLVVVFDLKGVTAIDFIYGRKHVLLADSAVLYDETMRDMNLKGFWTMKGLSGQPDSFEMDVNQVQHDVLRREGHLISFNGKLIVIWQKDSEKLFNFQEPVAADIVLVRGNCPENLEALMKSFHFVQLVTDGSLPPWQKQKWILAAGLAGVSVHDTRNDGAFAWNSAKKNND